MGTVTIKNNLCPFCHNKLIKSRVKCPNNILFKCLECVSCKVYFYSKNDYDKLRALSEKQHRKLNRNVIAYKDAPKPPKPKPSKPKSPKHNTYKNRQKSKTITELPIEKNIYSNPAKNKNCLYYKNENCIYIDEKCNMNSVRCPKNTLQKRKNIQNNHSEKENHVSVSKTKYKSKVKSNIMKVGVTAIVLSDNRKCIHNNHILQDVKAELRIVTPYGKIINYSTLDAYCNKCDKYFVLKCDFKEAQRHGGDSLSCRR